MVAHALGPPLHSERARETETDATRSPAYLAVLVCFDRRLYTYAIASQQRYRAKEIEGEGEVPPALRTRMPSRWGGGAAEKRRKEHRQKEKRRRRQRKRREAREKAERQTPLNHGRPSSSAGGLVGRSRTPGREGGVPYTHNAKHTMPAERRATFSEASAGSDFALRVYRPQATYTRTNSSLSRSLPDGPFTSIASLHCAARVTSLPFVSCCGA